MGLREFVASLAKGAAEEDEKGWIFAASRRLEVLLRSVGFKNRVRHILSGIDPAHTPDLVKKALMTDPSMGLSVLAALPKVGNSIIGGLRELTLQAERWPAPLTANMMRDSLSRLKLEWAGEAAGRYTAMSFRIAAEKQDWAGLSQRYMRGLSRGLSPDELRAGLSVLAAQADRFVADNPQWVEAVLVGVEEALARHPRLRSQVVGPAMDILKERSDA